MRHNSGGSGSGEIVFTLLILPCVFPDMHRGTFESVLLPEVDYNVELLRFLPVQTAGSCMVESL